MRIADGIEMLDISAMVLGKPNAIHPTLLWDDEIAVLVDASFPGQAASLREAIEKAGVPSTKPKRKNRWPNYLAMTSNRSSATTVACTPIMPTSALRNWLPTSHAIQVLAKICL